MFVQHNVPVTESNEKIFNIELLRKKLFILGVKIHFLY